MQINLSDIHKIKQGDEISFRKFVETYSDDLFYYARGFVKTKEMAEEVVSDVFVTVWKKKGELDAVRNIRTWLFVLVHNEAISYLRKEADIVRISLEEINEYCIPSIQSPDYDLISKEEIEQINQAISLLPPKCKLVFTLAKLHGLPYKEISQVLNISIKTINIHIAKALQTISAVLHKK